MKETSMTTQIINTEQAICSYPKGVGAYRFQLGGFYITFYCNLISDVKQVGKLLKEYGLTKPGRIHEIKKFGLKIVADSDGVRLYRNDKFPLKAGEQKWVFNLKHHGKEVQAVYGVSLQLSPSDSAFEVDFCTQSKIDAAISVVEHRFSDMLAELRREMIRITQQSLADKTPRVVTTDLEVNNGVVERPKAKAAQLPALKSKKKRILKRR